MIRSIHGKTPQIAADAFVAENATVIGDVTVGERASIWYGCVVRGDVERIVIGPESNLQDLSVIHVDSGGWATILGRGVTVGHRVVLHGCTIHDSALIGMGSVIMNGAEIGEGSIVGAGALVTPGTKIPPGMLAVGSPAKPKRPLTDAEKAELRESAAHYVQYAREHRG